ncbi:MAG: hypothetical protein MMC23_003523 [Stictis urceolatum]|nr:hypothetical protein [Stictis urceolata]
MNTILLRYVGHLCIFGSTNDEVHTYLGIAYRRGRKSEEEEGEVPEPNYTPIQRLAYYNSLDNGLEIAPHECPQALNWHALRRGLRLGTEAGSDTGVSEEDDGDDEGLEYGGVPGAMMEIRRHYRHSESEVRKSFFVPGVWSRSGAKQDLAESLDGARDEAKAAMEKCRGWWNADLIAVVEGLGRKVEEEVWMPLQKAGHKNYCELTGKTDGCVAELRREVQRADLVRKEFVRLGRESVLADPVGVGRAMGKRFDWEDVRRGLEGRKVDDSMDNVYEVNVSSSRMSSEQCNVRVAPGVGIRLNSMEKTDR